MNDLYLERISDSSRRLGRVFIVDDEDDLRVWSRRHDPQTALEIQSRVLPTRPPNVPGYRISFWSQPAAEVGGDHFNFCNAGGDSLGILIADVSGKGIGAAIIVTMLRATFRTQTWGNHNVGHVLPRANEFISHALPRGTFITCTYGILDASQRRFTFARAGHEPLLLVRNGQVQEISPPGLPLGIATESEFCACLDIEKLNLEPRDRLVFITDGLTEAMNPEQEEFGMARIIETLIQSEGNDVEALANAVKAFTRGAPQHDDMTIVSLVVD